MHSLQMTSESEWDPHSGDWSRLEEELRDALNSNYDLQSLGINRSMPIK